MSTLFSMKEQDEKNYLFLHDYTTLKNFFTQNKNNQSIIKENCEAYQTEIKDTSYSYKIKKRYIEIMFQALKDSGISQKTIQLIQKTTSQK